MISVIIPIYNAEKYISRCIDSVIDQTYNDLEILLIDDGSTDSSGEICKRFAGIDKRVKYLWKENSGPGDTRALGIKIAKGEFVFFLDSDDYIAPNALEVLYGEMSSDIDCVIGQHERFGNLGKIKQVRFPVGEYYFADTDCKTYTDSMLECRFGCELWNKLIRTQVAKVILGLSLHVKFGEDFLSISLIFLHCRTVKCIDAITYYYEFKEDSLARNSMFWRILPQYVDQCVGIEQCFCENKIQYYIFPLFTFRALSLSLVRYSGRDSQSVLKKDFQEIQNDSDLRRYATMFMSEKKRYKKKYRIDKTYYDQAYCFYKTILKRDVWYYLKLYPALQEKKYKKYVIKAYIKKIIGGFNYGYKKF